MKFFAFLLLVSVSVVYSAPQPIEFAIIDVINSAIPNVAINIPTVAVRPIVNIPARPIQGGASAFASAQGRPGSQTFVNTNIRRDDDDRK